MIVYKTEYIDDYEKVYISLFIPTFCLTYKQKSDTVGLRKGFKFNFSTKFIYEVNNFYKKAQLILLGFGFSLTYVKGENYDA